MTRDETRRIKSPYWSGVEAQRILMAVDDQELYGTPQGRDMISAAHVWATLALRQSNPSMGGDRGTG
ncbi:hypothetical protein [Nocardiopsis flavescens]|nr:hypothetical protein [Nocardiopsis flavescens]